MNKHLMVEIIAYAPTAYYHCTHCEVARHMTGASNQVHHEQVESSLPLELMLDYQRVSDWIRGLVSKHCDSSLVVKVIDAASVEGVWKSLRYRLRKYPAIVINGQFCFNQGEFDTASEEIAHMLKDARSA